jgi:hypothetical protein
LALSRGLARDERQLARPVEAAGQRRRGDELVHHAHTLGEYGIALGDRRERAALDQGQRVPGLRGDRPEFDQPAEAIEGTPLLRHLPQEMGLGAGEQVAYSPVRLECGAEHLLQARAIEGPDLLELVKGDRESAGTAPACRSPKPGPADKG